MSVVYYASVIPFSFPVDREWLSCLWLRICCLFGEPTLIPQNIAKGQTQTMRFLALLFTYHVTYPRVLQLRETRFFCPRCTGWDPWAGAKPPWRWHPWAEVASRSAWTWPLLRAVRAPQHLHWEVLTFCLLFCSPNQNFRMNCSLVIVEEAIWDKLEIITRLWMHKGNLRSPILYSSSNLRKKTLDENKRNIFFFSHFKLLLSFQSYYSPCSIRLLEVICWADEQNGRDNWEKLKSTNIGHNTSM